MSKTDNELFHEFLMSKNADGRTISETYLSGFKLFLDTVIADLMHHVINGKVDPVEEIELASGEVSALKISLESLRNGFIAYKASNEAADDLRPVGI